jgi:hypothetical protein
LLEVSFTSDWYAYLDAAGIEIGSSEFTIGCTTADPGLADLLHVASGRAVLTMEQRICDHTGRPFNVAFCHSRSDKFSLVTIAVSETLQSTSRSGGRNQRAVRLHADSEPTDPMEWYSWMAPTPVVAGEGTRR